MPLPIGSGISIGVFPNNSISNPPGASATGWISLTEHNREPIDFSYENITKEARMANGYMRKYVVAQKKNLSVDWNMVPSVASVQTMIVTGSAGYANTISNLTVDGKPGGAWIKEFYENNVFIPIWVKVTHSTASATGDYTNGFFPTASVYTSLMNSASYFSYPTTTLNVGTPLLPAQPDI
ncbi:hypothetical protein EBU94_09605, partial [bacterium]|nr:hypothetical protein [bacterium]